MAAKTSARVDAKVLVEPKATQVVLVTFLVLCGLSLVLSCLFLFVDHPRAWVPWAFTCLLAGMSGIGWWRSQGAHELAAAAPTILKLPDAELHTDALTLNSHAAAEALSRIVATLTYRQPLPSPDGLLGADMKPIPGSEEAAKERAAEANRQAEVLRASAVEFIQVPSTQLPTRSVQEITGPTGEGPQGKKGSSGKA